MYFCQKNNLRICTKSQNCSNRTAIISGKSKYKGVSWSKAHKLWLAQIAVNGKNKNLGRFKTEEEAALKYNEAAIELHKEFAYINTI